MDRFTIRTNEGDLKYSAQQIIVVGEPVEEPTPAPDPSPVPDPQPEPKPQPDPVTVVLENVSQWRMNIRVQPSTADGVQIVGQLLPGERVTVVSTSKNAEGYIWRQIASSGFWIAQGEIGGEKYLEPVTDDKPAPAPVPMDSQPLPFQGRYVLKQYKDATYLDGALGMGVNLRELAYFPTDEMKHVNEGDAFWLLDRARQWGFNIVRVYFPHQNVPFGGQLDLFKRVLDMAAAKGLRVMAVMEDHQASGYHLPEDVQDGFRDWHGYVDAETAENLNGLLRPEWYESRFRKHYMPRLIEFVKRFGHYQNLIIDLINEPGMLAVDRNHANFNIMRNFAAEASEAVWTHGNGEVPCTVGFIETPKIDGADALQSALEFYSELPHIQVVSNHIYYKKLMTGDRFMFEDGADKDAEAAKLTGRAYMVSEIGVSEAFGKYRPSLLTGGLTRQIVANGATSVMQWSFDPNSANDRGYSDEYAVAAWRDSDYQASMNVLQDFAEMYASYDAAIE